MADITMCVHTLCPNAWNCYRVQATPSQHWQSMMAFQYTVSVSGVECDNYWPMDKAEYNVELSGLNDLQEKQR